MAIQVWVWSDPRSEWVEAEIADTAHRFVRTQPVVAHKMVRDFYVIGRDGNKQIGRSGDFLVMEDGFARVEDAATFNLVHFRVVPPSGAEQDEVRSLFTSVIEDVLQQRELPLSDSDYEKLAAEAADAILATIATMQ